MSKNSQRVKRNRREKWRRWGSLVGLLPPFESTMSNPLRKHPENDALASNVTLPLHHRIVGLFSKEARCNLGECIFFSNLGLGQRPRTWLRAQSGPVRPWRKPRDLFARLALTETEKGAADSPLHLRLTLSPPVCGISACTGNG